MIDPKQKRITIKVSKDIDQIRDRLAADTGIEMTYNQIFNFLVIAITIYHLQMLS